MTESTDTDNRKRELEKKVEQLFRRVDDLEKLVAAQAQQIRETRTGG